MSRMRSKGFQEYWAKVMKGRALWRSPIKAIALNAYKAGVVQAQKEQEEHIRRKDRAKAGFV